MELPSCRRAGAVQLGRAWHGAGASLRFRRPARLIRPTNGAHILSAYSRSKVYQPPTSPSPAIRNFEIELPRLEEVNGGKAFQGALAGVIIGTALSLGVSTVKASFVAGVVAAFVALVPILGSLDVEDELENEGAELPGVAVISAAVQGKQALQGEKPLAPDNTATVLAASVSAGALVAIFAAKSLGIAIAGAAGFITLRRDGDLNLQKSTRNGRDFLRTRGYSGPGVAASLLLLQAKDAAVKVGDAVQGRKDAFSGDSPSFPSEEGVYSITRTVSPAASSQNTPAANPVKPFEEPIASAQPLKSVGQPGTSPADQEPAESLLEEALRLRGVNGSQKQAAAIPSNGSAPKEKATAKNGSAAPSENEDLLKQAMELRGQGSGMPDPEDPKDKKKPASPAPKKTEKEVPEPEEDLLAQALKFRESGKGDTPKAKVQTKSLEKQTPAVASQGPQEDLLAEAMKFRQSGSGNGSKPSRATQKPQPSPKPTTKAAAPSQGSGSESGNLLEEALRLRNGGTASPSPPPSRPATAGAPQQNSPGATFKGERSDDLILRAQDATPTATPGQQPLKASTDGTGSEENVDALGKSWQDSSQGGIQQSSAASLPRSDSLIMQSQQNNGGKPQGMPKLSVGSAGSGGQGQTNPAARRGPSLGDRATEQPLKGALKRQQEQSKVSAADQEKSPPLGEEESEEGEGLLAEALRLRGQAPSTPAKAPPKPTAAKAKEAVEKPTEGEDLLAAALKFRGEQQKSGTSNGSNPIQKAEKADEKLSQGEDLLAEAMRFRNEQPAKKAASAGSKQPTAKIGKAEKAEEKVSEGEDLLAEALRLRGETLASAAPKRTAPKPVAAAKGSAEVDDSKNTDLLAEALRLRAEGLASSPKASSPQGKPTSPLENLKGSDRVAAGGGLASGSTSFTPSGSTLSGDQSGEKSSSDTPLEKMKGGNKDIEAGDLASTPVEFTPTEKDPLLKGDSPAQKDASPESGTPLEKVKGGNRDVESGDLASTPVEFTPTEKDPLLKGDSPAQQGANSDSGTPLEKVKGGNKDVKAGDLASTPVEFTPTDREALLKASSQAQQDARAVFSTPLGRLKGLNEEVEAGDLASDPVEFTPSKEEPLLKGDSTALKDARAGPGSPLENVKGGKPDVKAGDLVSSPSEGVASKGEPLLQPDSPAQPGKIGGQTPLQRMKGKGTPYEPVLSSNVPFRPGFKESLLAKTPKDETPSSSQEGKSLRGNILQVAQLAGLGRALQLLSRSPEAAASTSSQPQVTGQGSEGGLGTTPDRAKAGLSQSNVLQLQTDGLGKSISMRGFSSRASGSAASAPYEIGRSAIEQELPEKQPPARRSAARPSPALRVQPPSRPAAQGVNIPSLTKSSAATGTSPVYPYVGRANVPGASKEPRRLTPQEQLQAAAVAGGVPASKGRTAVENWLLVLGSGLVGSLVGLTWRLVQGFAVAEPVNKVLMAAIMVCMVLIVVLTSLDRPTDRANPAAA